MRQLRKGPSVPCLSWGIVVEVLHIMRYINLLTYLLYLQNMLRTVGGTVDASSRRISSPCRSDENPMKASKGADPPGGVEAGLASPRLSSLSFVDTAG